ncbi:helix-turn-helix domain-containing protein [Gracilibacillus salinarum]|uniref:Helix-turn-helix transcriptional regulator n=1 Tax=Gracilibacillus salinarum TaxID=2932255 RepID=A0ABY4GQT6_9BACI|nr:helix-turn-helix transcriptional regulator [Gracilibacillus salinarum]UOQ85657.1 helix-turn-helix transcriptional regulator [Gracilibacillus salinarum]
MTVFERVKKLCDEQGMSIVELEEKIGFGRNSLYKWKKQNPKTETLEKVADYFDVSTDYLLGRTDKKRYYDLTEKDEQAIQRELKKIIDGEDVDSAFAAFDGRVLEELNEEDRELLIQSWANTLRLTKRMAKQKFTRKDYRK